MVEPELLSFTICRFQGIQSARQEFSRRFPRHPSPATPLHGSSLWCQQPRHGKHDKCKRGQVTRCRTGPPLGPARTGVTDGQREESMAHGRAWHGRAEHGRAITGRKMGENMKREGGRQQISHPARVACSSFHCLRTRPTHPTKPKPSFFLLLFLSQEQESLFASSPTGQITRAARLIHPHAQPFPFQAQEDMVRTMICSGDVRSTHPFPASR